MAKIVITLILCAALCGCATSKDVMSSLIGNSTAEIEEWRGEADIKVFDYRYEKCYAKMRRLLKEMPNVSIYATTGDMIAVFYLTPDTTPVGVYFGEVSAKQTQVEVASPSTPAKQWIAKNLFSEKVLAPQKPVMKIEQQTVSAKESII
ncbi:MAG: hypothetical protein JXB40_00855 [Candidatus Omnitrophica bacterium]|nr:hypothetical protein [Candidatus Omnitrophota bacterium]